MLKKKLGMAVFSAIFGASLIGAGTSAIYTSTATNEGNTFASGTLVVELENYDSNTGHYFDITNMAPGDSEEAIMHVVNTGSLDLRFDVSHMFTAGTLGQALTVDYYYNDNGNWVAVTGPIEIPATDPDSMAEIKVVVTLPLATGNEYQGTSATMEIKVDAVQTKNN